MKRGCQASNDFELTFTPDTAISPDVHADAASPSEGDAVFTAIPNPRG
jgi:hypothetical protein